MEKNAVPNPEYKNLSCILYSFVKAQCKKMCTYIIQFLLAIFARIFARIRDILHVSGRLDIDELALFFNFEKLFFLNISPLLNKVSFV